MIILGDSWAAGWNCDNYSTVGGWPEILGVPKEKNFSVPGSTAKQWADGIYPLPDVVGETVIVSIGGNDLIVLLDVHVESQTVQTIELIGNLSFVFDSILCGVPNRFLAFEYANPTDRSDVDLYLSALNAQIRYQANGRTLRTQDFLKPEHFKENDFHPNLAGQKLIAEKIKEIIV